MKFDCNTDHSIIINETNSEAVCYIYKKKYAKLLKSAPKMQQLLETVLDYSAEGLTIDERLANQIIDVLAGIEGKQFAEKVDEVVERDGAE